jgi:hypothetical protein
VQVDAKLTEELLRQELSDQHAESAAALRAQLLQHQQHQLEALQGGVEARLTELQAAVKASDAQAEHKVRESLAAMQMSCADKAPVSLKLRLKPHAGA